jgi:gliding motility-associated-like protein
MNCEHIPVCFCIFLITLMLQRFLTAFFLFFALHATAQKEWSNWYYSGNNLLTFKNGTPELLRNFIPNVPPPFNPVNFAHWGSRAVSYSDPVTGEMKFLISSLLGFDRNFNVFPANANTWIRACNGDKYAYHIIPFSGNADKFYVVQFQSAAADLLAQESGLQVRCPNAIGLAYSVVDLTQNGGLGDFTQMNMRITGGNSEHIALVRHANGKDVWVIVHGIGNNSFSAYLFTDAGVQPAVTSSLGPTIGSRYINLGGQLVANHEGNLLAGNIAGVDGMMLLDFDKASGRISNYRLLPAGTGGIGTAQFSPDDSKLYYTSGDAIYQYDFNEADLAGSLTKVYDDALSDLIYDLQLAPDGKIYFTKTYVNVNGQWEEFTGSVECPNLPQYACNVNPTRLSTVSVFFPPLINDFIKDPKAPAVTKFNIGKDTAVCFGTYTIKAPDGWEQYKWNTGETSKEITVSKAGTYYVLTGNSGFSCPTGYGYIEVTDAAVKLDLGRDTTLCPNDSFRLTIPATYNNILWTNGSSTRDTILKQGSSTVIKATDSRGCSTADTVLVMFKNLPAASFGTDTTLCNQQTLLLKMQPLANSFYRGDYLWSTGGTDDSLRISSAGTYWGRVSYQGCTVSDTIRVGYISASSVNLGKDTVLCEGDSLLLNASAGNAIYTWSTGEQTEKITVKQSGTYHVTVKSSICSLKDTISVQFIPRPVFNLGGDTSICTGDSILLDPGISADRYSWQNGSNSRTLRAKVSGTYNVKVTVNGCSSSDSLTLAHFALPTINLGGDTSFCKGDSILLRAVTSGTIANWQWNTGSNATTLPVKTAGQYIAQVRSTDGCMARDSILVSSINPPVFSLGADTVLCEQTQLNYNFTIPSATYMWNNGSSQAQYSISQTGTYTLTVNQNGCKASDTVTVGYKPLPVVQMGRDTTVCEPAQLQLNAANSNSTYLWNNGSTNSTLTVIKSGLYHVLVNKNGCTARDSIKIEFTPVPYFTLGKDTIVCIGRPLELQPRLNTLSSFQWSNGSTSPSLLVSTAGIYSLTAKNNCGSFMDDISISEGICAFYMPNAFTPNKDGRNDLFKLPYPVNGSNYKLSVYNRYGQLVYETTQMPEGWDGTYKQQEQPPGVYAWTVVYTDQNGIVQKANGWVQLIR